MAEAEVPLRRHALGGIPAYRRNCAAALEGQLCYPAADGDRNLPLHSAVHAADGLDKL
ncbi:hypothetical protein D3C71_1857420 [compost metagenome]